MAGICLHIQQHSQRPLLDKLRKERQHKTGAHRYRLATVSRCASPSAAICVSSALAELVALLLDTKLRSPDSNAGSHVVKARSKGNSLALPVRDSGLSPAISQATLLCIFVLRWCSM